MQTGSVDEYIDAGIAFAGTDTVYAQIKESMTMSAYRPSDDGTSGHISLAVDNLTVQQRGPATSGL